MFDISFKEAVDKMMKYDPALHLDVYYWSYLDSLNDDLDLKCSVLSGCAVIFNTRYNFDKCERYDMYRIHQVADECNYETVLRMITDNRDKSKDTKIVLSVSGGLPNNYNGEKGLLRYCRTGEYCEDSDIKVLDYKDYDSIKEITYPDEDDNRFAQEDAGSFNKWFEKYDENIATILGIYDGDKLCGLVDVYYFEEFGLAMFNNMFVKKEYRQKGYAKRLVKAALSLHPDKKYILHADVENPVAINLVNSLGFKRLGVWLSYDIDAEK